MADGAKKNLAAVLGTGQTKYVAKRKDVSMNGLVREAINIMPRRRRRQRSVGNMGSTRAGRSKRAVWRKRRLRSI